MVITVTSIKLKSVWYFFRLSAWGYKIQKQLRKEPGFIKMKNTGFGYDHYTLSVWQSENDLKRFARSGVHAEAMKQSRSLSTEIRTYTFTSDIIPGWPEAKDLLRSKAKVLQFK